MYFKKNQHRYIQVHVPQIQINTQTLLGSSQIDLTALLGYFLKVKAPKLFTTVHRLSDSHHSIHSCETSQVDNSKVYTKIVLDH